MWAHDNVHGDGQFFHDKRILGGVAQLDKAEYEG